MELNKKHVHGLLNGFAWGYNPFFCGVVNLFISGSVAQVAKITMTVHNKVRKELVKPRNSNHTSSGGLQITFLKANMIPRKNQPVQDICPIKHGDFL